MKYVTHLSYELIIFPRNHLLVRPRKSMFNTMKTHIHEWNEKLNSVRLFRQWLQWKTNQEKSSRVKTAGEKWRSWHKFGTFKGLFKTLWLQLRIVFDMYDKGTKKIYITIAYTVNHLNILDLHLLLFLEIKGKFVPVN